MSTSTTTLLQVVQSVLRDIGERPVTSLTVPRTNLIDKTLDAIRNSLTEIETIADWSWLRVRRNANTWLNERATLLDCRRVYAVEYVPPAGTSGSVHQPIPQIDTELFYRFALYPYPQSYTVPSYYARLDNENFLFNPYPTLVDDQNKIYFLFQESIQMPTLSSDVFPIPEFMIPLLKSWVCYNMSLTHLNDANTAKMFQDKMSIQTRLAIQRDVSNEPGVTNVYKGFRGQRWSRF